MSPKPRLTKFLTRSLLGLLILIPILLLVGNQLGARLHYADNPLAQNWDGEGPYVFFTEDGGLSVQHLVDDGSGGYVAQEVRHAGEPAPEITSHYPLDDSHFEVALHTDFEPPASAYDDGERVFAVSDVEGNYAALRDLLIDSGVIDRGLRWTFGRGHLVLVGDIVDRGYFVTQLLWLVYRLEQDARDQGGQVHFIIGNHELKMMYGDYGVTDAKYAEVAELLGKSQRDLFGDESFLGRWMASKNSVERINGTLFVHGGLHPDIAGLGLDLDAVNQRIRSSYYQPVDPDGSGGLLTSRVTGPCWYRGYFKDDLTQEQVERVLARFDAAAVVVGHTLQKRINRQYAGKVIAIDVAHPNDDHRLWPEGTSEGLMIEDGVYLRVLAGGHQEAL